MVRPRPSRYKNVVVKGLVWEGHNHHRQRGQVQNADQELGMVLGAFESYGHRAHVTHIPKDWGQMSGFSHQLQNMLQSYINPQQDTLIILYYQGHGALDQQGHLVLSNGTGERMHWSNIANAIVNAQCDVLTILSCCHAGAAIRERNNLRPNYEEHLKQVIMAVPHNLKIGWGFADGFAACLEQALREHRDDWEPSFLGTPFHWTEAINRVMRKKTGGSAHVRVDHLVRPPQNAAGQPIVLSPRMAC
ncbi:MAG: hypothetical protein M1822_009168 [Bathelium mastoideum]|nr:MAG: hypothetical protein M1822_009168 [Bathelium mastoideum]